MAVWLILRSSNKRTHSYSIGLGKSTKSNSGEIGTGSHRDELSTYGAHSRCSSGDALITVQFTYILASRPLEKCARSIDSPVTIDTPSSTIAGLLPSTRSTSHPRSLTISRTRSAAGARSARHSSLKEYFS
ncbi:Uncharacterized protein HZ326_23423 [Fusarium oxysporum f. sp. albedinis]|nr:Uncharacterized protein HZ326_23423 [Fusarium oxysporum f. sp. albedinis]